jgi:hypothetical protein
MTEFKLPKTIGACADLLYELRQKRAEIQKQADAVEADEKKIVAHLIEVLPANDAEGVLGTVARVCINTKVCPTAEDWPKIYRYITKHGAFDLLQRRLAGPAVSARWDDGKVIPGVGKYVSKQVSCTKR